MRRCRGDAGVTLLELLLAIAIMGLIAVPLAASLIVGLKTTKEANAELTDANSVALLAVFLPPDVQEIKQDFVGGPIEFHAPDCRGAGNGTADVVFHHVDPANPNPLASIRTSYTVETVAGKPALIRRDGALAGDGSPGCKRQIIAPGLATAPPYTLTEGGNLKTYCVDQTTPCDGQHSSLKRVTIDLTTSSGYHVQYGATTRS